MTSNSASDSSEPEQVSNEMQDAFFNLNAIQPAPKNHRLAEIGYYESEFYIQKDLSQTMEILLSGEESRVRSEYVRRGLRSMSQKPDGTKYYTDTTVHLMAQVLHSQDRLAEARRQIDFLEDFIAKEELKLSHEAKASTDASITETGEALKKTKILAEEMIKANNNALVEASVLQRGNTYKPRYETLVEHIEKSNVNLKTLIDDLRSSRKRPLEEDTEMSDAPQQDVPKRLRRSAN